MRRCALILLLLVITALVGCCPAKQANNFRGQPRSMVFDGEAMLAMRGMQVPGDVPWYAQRNDVQPSVDAGFSSPTFSSTYTRTYDQQGQSHGNVHDHYYKRSYQYGRQHTIQ